MIDFGITLRKAREAKGMSVEQVAEKTHLMSQMIRDLEDENFSKIAAPIYGRGFVKLYCDAIGLEAKPMIAEFMDIFTGRREPTIRVREVPTPPPSTPVAEAAIVTEPTKSEPPKVDAPTFDTLVTAAPEIRTTENIPAAAIPPRTPAPSRYAAPIPLDEREESVLTPSPLLMWIKSINWRAAVVIVAALLVVWFMISSVRWLYHATMNDPAQGNVSEATTTEASATEKKEIPTDSKGESVKRNPERIPPLYID